MHARLIASVAALLAVLAGCGSGGTAGSPGPAHGGATAECPPVDHAAIDPNATFTWMYSVANTSFDPDKITTSNSQMYLYPIYDSLVHLDDKGEPRPMLARSWSVGDGGRSLTLQLVDNWKYHDGTPFDAASVKANLDRHRGEGSFNRQALSDISGVSVLDRRTVKIETINGAAPLVGILASSAGMMMSPAVFNDPGQSLKPTGGSGAFSLASYQPGSKVEYSAVPGYWEPDALRVAKMVFLISSDDNARLNSVITGAADATFLRESMYAPAKGGGLVVCQKPSMSSYTMALNVARSEFAKPEVRRAINLAVDRSAIAAITDGFCDPSVQMFPTSFYASDPELTPDRYPHDVAKARQLLDSVGLGRGFEFTLETNNLDAYQKVAEVIQANLQEVGIRVTVLPVELPRLMEDFSVNKKADAQLVQQKAEADPSIQIEAYYLRGGFSNPGDYGNPAISQLHTQAKAAATTNERAEIYRKLFAKAHEEAASPVILCHLTTPMATNQKVMGLEIYSDGSRQFRGIAVRK
ncbi:peptide/nickel transport system substrate-binding protein [Pseudonocardia eucalypti]|uniref:ABC transporter substrate-binding protein n=1 Tax=Pseudonocardia eucalypti TaxID=648755 RepID=UPI001618670A|nr:peptide/nickel transport system substrate-binding protein [Pseudonocardia eucalypti]